MKSLSGLVLLSLFLMFAAVSCVKAAPGNTPLVTNNTTTPVVVLEKPGVGDPAPAFTLTDMAGKTVSLADYKGKVVWLNFWATW